MRKDFWKLIFLSALAVILCLPGTAGADWSQRFHEDGWYNGTHFNFDKLEVFLMSPDDFFKDPGMTDFDVAGWQGNLINPRYTLAQGPSVGDLYWTFQFLGPQSNPFSMDYLFYSGDDLFVSRINWSGSSWSYVVDIDPAPSYDRFPTMGFVPQPNSIILVCSGLALVVLGRRIRRDKKRYKARL
jgi:hypothetical protein